MAEPFPAAPVSEATRTAPAGPGGDPITDNDRVGGSRNYKGPTLGALAGWKCPACGTENSGPLERGCTSCGSGSAAPYHVDTKPREVAFDTTTPILQPIDQGFERWLDDQAPGVPPNLRKLLFAAWQGGIQWYQGMLQGAERTPAQVGETISVPKALLERVIATLEQTYDLPEQEQQSPEFLALIAQLKELVE